MGNMIETKNIPYPLSEGTGFLFVFILLRASQSSFSAQSASLNPTRANFGSR